MKYPNLFYSTSNIIQYITTISNNHVSNQALGKPLAGPWFWPKNHSSLKYVFIPKNGQQETSIYQKTIGGFGKPLADP